VSLIWIKHGVGVASPHTPDCDGAGCKGCNGPGHWAWDADQAEPIPGLARAINDHRVMLERVTLQRGATRIEDVADVVDALAQRVEFAMAQIAERPPVLVAGRWQRPEEGEIEFRSVPARLRLARVLARVMLIDLWRRIQSGR
jgi:hypothetical protein